MKEGGKKSKEKNVKGGFAAQCERSHLLITGSVSRGGELSEQAVAVEGEAKEDDKR